ncbi:38600_t:CDS:1, partial [Gigaspora margarita]
SLASTLLGFNITLEILLLLIRKFLLPPKLQVDAHLALCD